jgi:RNA 2',3'-cyclic 3'-phosphodiesterase
MRRLFVALEMPEVVREQLSTMLSGVPDARWVDPENFHLTLRFIGEVDGGAAEEIAGSLSRLRAPSFNLTLEGLGYFESRGRLRALWVGVRPEPALVALQRKIEHAVVAVGPPAEGRKFKPHVTLARFSKCPVAAVAPYLVTHGGIRSDAFPVESLVLFESKLGHGGPTYHPELEIPLMLTPTSAAGGRDRAGSSRG